MLEPTNYETDYNNKVNAKSQQPKQPKCDNLYNLFSMRFEIVTKCRERLLMTYLLKLLNVKIYQKIYVLTFKYL